MKKLATLTVAFALLFATSAQAKDLGGKFGLGYEATLGGAQGLSVSYFVTHALAIDVLLGFKYAAPDVGDGRMGFNAMLGARYNFARAKDVNLGIGLRFDLGFANKEAMVAGGGGADSSFHANIELPLIVEYFFSEHFAINLGVGILIEIIPEDGAVFPETGPAGVTAGNKGFALSFFQGGAFGEAGFKFYF